MTDTPETTAAPEAATTPTLDPAAELDALRAKYEKAQKDLAKFRTRADEVETARKNAEAEALKHKSLEEQIAALAKRAEDAERTAQAAEARRTEAERLATLTGKVADPRAALKLLEDTHLDDDGNVLVDALLSAYPFLAPTQAQAARPAVPSANAARASGDGPLRPEDFAGKPHEWIVDNLHRLKGTPR